MAAHLPKVALDDAVYAPVVVLDRDMARYVADMVGELQRLVHRPRFMTLRYLLEMAKLEAEQVVQGCPE